MPTVAPPRVQIPVNPAKLNVSISSVNIKIKLCNMSLFVRLIRSIDATFLQRSDIKVITEQSCGLTKKRKFQRPGNIVNMLQMQKVLTFCILSYLSYTNTDFALVC